MAFLTWNSPLTTEERARRRQLIFSDALALSTLFIIVVALAVVTTSLYRSYASHQATLAQRWFDRGESALQNGNPEAAVEELRSALALAPGQRRIEIALAGALASAGRIQEATSYFNTLAESEPGSGIINLQLARLAARQGNLAQGLEDYHRSIYGTWEGDGYLRRREVRMELVRFLVSHAQYSQAQSELLIAAGNAPEDDTAVRLEIAQWMEKAQDPRDAYNVYGSLMQHHPPPLEALQGAGRTAFQMGRFQQAKLYLERAVNSPEAHRRPDQPSRDLLRDVDRLLLLDPSLPLTPHERSGRVLADRNIAQARFASCAAQQVANETPEIEPPAGSASSSVRSLPKSLQGSLENFASRFKRPSTGSINSGSAAAQNPPAPDDFLSLAARWKQPTDAITISGLENDPALMQSQIQLIYDTEQMAQKICGTPSGDDALLLKMAQAPNTGEQE